MRDRLPRLVCSIAMHDRVAMVGWAASLRAVAVPRVPIDALCHCRAPPPATGAADGPRSSNPRPQQKPTRGVFSISSERSHADSPGARPNRADNKETASFCRHLVCRNVLARDFGTSVAVPFVEQRIPSLPLNPAWRVTFRSRLTHDHKVANVGRPEPYGWRKRRPRRNLRKRWRRSGRMNGPRTPRARRNPRAQRRHIALRRDPQDFSMSWEDGAP